MKHDVEQVKRFLAFVRIARVELILAKLEDMFRGLDIDASDPMWAMWEEQYDDIGHALAEFVDDERWVVKRPSDDEHPPAGEVRSDGTPIR